MLGLLGSDELSVYSLRFSVEGAALLIVTIGIAGGISWGGDRGVMGGGRTGGSSPKYLHNFQH